MDDQNELFIVVDKSDNVREYRTRYDCHHDKTLIHRAVGILVINDKGQILLQKRSKKKDTYKGFYTLSASGHVKIDESYKQAAERELFEELGIKSKIKYIKKFLLQVNIENEIDAIFKTRHNGPFEINKKEVEEVEFFSPGQIEMMLGKITPAAIESLRQVNIL